MTDKFIYVNLDLNGQQIKNVKAEALASAPTGSAGRMYYNTTTGLFGVYDAVAAEWKYIGSGGISTTLPSGNILVGNASNIATAVAASGEASISNTGAITLSNTAVIEKVITGFSSAPGTVAATDTILQAIQKLDGNLSALDSAVILKGSWDASVGTFPGAGIAQAGWSYIVSVAGTVDGVEFSINDRVIAILDNASTTTYASNWFKADYTDQVLSVHSRTGAVVSASGDYTATQITNTPAGNIAAVTVQAAINELDSEKVTANAAITGATNTKITYDAKGLVTAGAAATTADINDSTDRRYVTDAQQTVIGNTSGTNTGDQIAGNGLSGTSTLDVNVDDSTIEINTDALRVKDLGITNAKLAGGITYNKLATSYVANFTSGSFTAGVLTILAATHALGASADLDVTVKNASSVDVTDGVVVTTAGSGDVTITVNVGLEFNGRILIKRIA